MLNKFFNQGKFKFIKIYDESILFLVEICENVTPNFLIKRHLHFPI